MSKKDKEHKAIVVSMKKQEEKINKLELEKTKLQD